MKKLFLLILVGLFCIIPGSRSLQAQYLPASSNAIFSFLTWPMEAHRRTHGRLCFGLSIQMQ